MKTDTELLERKTTSLKPKTVRPPFWTRAWNAYQYKKRTDQSFFATVVAMQVLVVVLFLLAITAVVVKKSSLGNVGSTTLFKR